MSGRKQFDEEDALNLALKIFSRKGFHGASMQDLESATGLNKSSLYNAFGNKETLYGLCLEHYRTTKINHLLRKLDHQNYQTAITDFIIALSPLSETNNQSYDAISIWSALEMGQKNGFVGYAINHSTEEILTKITMRIQKAVHEQQLSQETNCQEIAALILAVARGVLVLHKGINNDKVVQHAIQALLKVVS